MISMFETPLKVAQVGKGHWRLDADLVFFSEAIGYVVVPEGFVTDFASVPRIPFAYMLTGGKASSASVIHDYLYSTQGVSRATADAVFYEAIRVEGHSRFTASLMWLGVRVGGWWAWDKPNVPQSPDVQERMAQEAP
jgi:hypothetical protein